MKRWFPIAVFALLASLAPAHAQTTSPKGYLGSWVRVTDEATIRMDIQKKTFTVSIAVEGQKLSVTSDYAISEGNILFGRVIRFVDEAKVGGPEKGLLFSFRIRKGSQNGTIQIDQLRGSDMARARELIHGKYYFAPKTD